MLYSHWVGTISLGPGGKRVGIATHCVGNHGKKFKDSVVLTSIIYTNMRKVSSSTPIINTTLWLASFHNSKVLQTYLPLGRCLTIVLTIMIFEQFCTELTVWLQNQFSAMMNISTAGKTSSIHSQMPTFKITLWVIFLLILWCLPFWFIRNYPWFSLLKFCVSANFTFLWDSHVSESHTTEYSSMQMLFGKIAYKISRATVLCLKQVWAK